MMQKTTRKSDSGNVSLELLSISNKKVLLIDTLSSQEALQ